MYSPAQKPHLESPEKQNHLQNNIQEVPKVSVHYQQPFSSYHQSVQFYSSLSKGHQTSRTGSFSFFIIKAWVFSWLCITAILEQCYIIELYKTALF